MWAGSASCHDFFVLSYHCPSGVDSDSTKPRLSQAQSAGQADGLTEPVLSMSLRRRPIGSPTQQLDREMELAIINCLHQFRYGRGGFVSNLQTLSVGSDHRPFLLTRSEERR